MSSERVWFSTTYFLYFAALSAIVPFIALYYQSLGLTGGQVGMLLGVPLLVTLFASPFWTGLADARNRHKLTLLVTMAMAVFLMAIFPTIRTFALALPFIMSFAFFSAPIMALVDNAILSKLGSQQDMYGRVRLWGTVGWGFDAPIAGGILQRYGLPFMFFSSFLLRKFKARGLLAVAMSVAGLRCILYSFSGGPQTVLVIQLLHGLTFPALWIAGVTYAAENAPPGLGATAQGLFGGVLLGFGAAAGSLLGGVLIDRLGVAGMYGTIGIIVLSSLVLMFVNEGHTGNQTPQAGL